MISRLLQQMKIIIITTLCILLLFQDMEYVPRTLTVLSTKTVPSTPEWNWTITSSKNLDMMTNSSAATIIIHMSGEMGNHISHLAHAYPIAWWAKRKYGIKTEFIIRDQQGRVQQGRVQQKTDSTRRIFTKCFPNLKMLYNGARANSPEYQIRLDQQHGWDMVNDTILQHINNGIKTEWDVDVTLEHLQVLVKSDAIPEIEENATISLPLLESTRMETGHFVNWFYHDLRWLLTFNDTACCAALPDADETVLHYRNFLSEMPKKGVALGFEELSPRMISEKLLCNLTTGDKVAITSRLVDKPVEDIADLLRARGIKVRLINGQLPEEDFCFLKNAEKELVGIAKSSFIKWAGILGDAALVRLYSVDSLATRRISPEKTTLYTYTNPALSRIHFGKYKIQEIDELTRI